MNSRKNIHYNWFRGLRENIPYVNIVKIRIPTPLKCVAADEPLVTKVDDSIYVPTYVTEPVKLYSKTIVVSAQRMLGVNTVRL